MKTHLLAMSGSALMLLSAPAAFAQTETGATAGGDPSSITCREISAMDNEQVRGILYYIQGYNEGQRGAGTTLGSVGGAAGTDIGTGTDTAGAMDTQTDLGTGADTDTAMTGTTGADVDTDVDTAFDAGADTDAAATTGAVGAAGTTGATGQFVAGLGTGYFEIPVERAISACESEPDARVVDILQRERTVQ
jgi:hypothetical protein